MTRGNATCAIAFAAAVAGSALAGEPAAHWDYGKQHGPAAWGGMSPEWATCSKGKSQSPIDLSSKAPALTAEQEAKLGAASITIGHEAHIADVLNNGHTVQVNYAGADVLAIGGVSYPLAQYHFHSPSEHTVDGKPFPMEMHLVHKSGDGKLAVVGVLIEQGAANAAFEPVWSKLPLEEGGDRQLGELDVDVDRLLPAGQRTAYRYEGSLTTPPCSEGVTWFVMKSPIQISAAQLEAFRQVIHGNNRPTQKLRGRAVATETLVYK